MIQSIKRAYDSRPEIKENISKILKEKFPSVDNHHSAKIYAGFISASGEVCAPVSNLNKFCRERGLNQAAMHRVSVKKNKHHKGWRLYEDCEETSC